MREELAQQELLAREYEKDAAQEKEAKRKATEKAAKKEAAAAKKLQDIIEAQNDVDAMLRKQEEIRKDLELRKTEVLAKKAEAEAEAAAAANAKKKHDARQRLESLEEKRKKFAERHLASSSSDEEEVRQLPKKVARPRQSAASSGEHKREDRPPQERKKPETPRKDPPKKVEPAKPAAHKEKVKEGFDPPTPPPSSSSSSSSSEDEGDSDKDGEKARKQKAAEKATKKAKKDAEELKALEESVKNKVPKPGKEGDTIKLLPLPLPPGFKAWKSATRQAVTAVSGRGQEAFSWIQALEKPGAEIEDFADSGAFESLDTKLAAAVTLIAKGECGRRITLLSESLAKQGVMMRGRQALLIVYREFNLDSERGLLYDLSDLMQVRCAGDQPVALEAFLASWEAVIEGLSEPQPEKTLEVLFYEQLKDSKALAAEVAHYNRQMRGHVDRSYEFLLTSLRRLLERNRQASTRKAMKDALGGKVPGIALVGAAVSDKASKSARKKAAKEEKATQEAHAVAAAAALVSDAKERGLCFDFQKGACKRGDKCTFLHEHEKPARAGSPGRDKGKGKGKKGGKSPKRSPSPGARTAEEKAKVPCKFHARGTCSFGKECHYSHDATAVGIGVVCIAVPAGRTTIDAADYEQCK